MMCRLYRNREEWWRALTNERSWPVKDGTFISPYAPAQISHFFLSSAHNFTTIIHPGTILNPYLCQSHKKPSSFLIPQSSLLYGFLQTFSNSISCSLLILEILPLCPMEYETFFSAKSSIVSTTSLNAIFLLYPKPNSLN